MLDFTDRKKKYLPVKLPDKTTVLLSSPRKSMYAKLITLQQSLENSEEYESLYEDILHASAEILSNNKEKRSFTTAEVDEMLDVEDLALLIMSYGQYANELTSSPN